MKRITSLSFLIFTVITAYFFSGRVGAAGGLNELSDIINNDEVSTPAEHLISFQLPVTSEAIVSTDYIHVYLAGYSNVTAPTSLSGSYSGTPVFSVSGNYARVTGIGLSPGVSLTIGGITATNPAGVGGFQVIVSVTEDEDGLLVKNIGNIVAIRGGSAITVSAMIDTPSASVLFSGYSAPNTFITFTEDGSVHGTDITNELGFFSKLLTGLSPGDHSFSLYGVDWINLTTAPHVINVYAPIYTQTNITDILLSPTLQISDNEILQGEDIIASGSAKPDSNITLFTESPLRTYYATATSSGAWSYTIDNTDEYVVGDYTIYAMAQDDFGVQSFVSIALGFSVVSATGGSGTACGDITRGDLNCDDSINLTDFSILMYYWGTANATADMNTDGVVNLTDFSIQMYWWGT
jgi:hypothetical protein